MEIWLHNISDEKIIYLTHKKKIYEARKTRIY